MNDALRQITASLGGVAMVSHAVGFDITVASEIMAILCLYRPYPRLMSQVIIIGYRRDKTAIMPMSKLKV